MDFFAYQDSARRRSGLLVLLFTLAVALTIAAIYAAVAFIMSYGASGGARAAVGWWNSELALIVTTAVLLIVGGGSLYKIAALRGGGESVARMLGARRVSPRTTDPDERKYLNIVEEMAIASGIPTPPAYVLDNERGINAFAAGYSTDAAVVCVTEGALRRLTRDELQGVVAHEFSHIFNADMRLNIRIIGVLHGLLLIALIGHILLRSVRFSGRGRRSKDGRVAAVIVLVGLTFLIVGSIGVFFGRLIQAAVSRQREFLADASAVQFTRNPAGLAGALKKIAMPAIGSAVDHDASAEMSHMFFANCLRGGLFNLFSTHPPIEERIRRLDPSYHLAAASGPAAISAVAATAPAVSGLAVATPSAPPADVTPPSTPPRPPPLPTAAPEQILAGYAAPWNAHLDAVRALLASLPEKVRDAAREPAGAQGLVCALLLDRDRSEVRRAQLKRLRSTAGAGFAAAVEQLATALADVPEGFRLAVIDLCRSTLRELPDDDFEAFLQDVEALIQADARVSLFELAARRLLRRLRGAERRAGGGALPHLKSAAGLGAEISCLLSALAYAGQPDAEAAAQAFAAAAQRAPAGVRLQLLPPDRCGVAAVEGALDAVSRLEPNAQRWLVEAALVCVAHSGRVEPREADLFRAIAAALDCPVPLWV